MNVSQYNALWSDGNTILSIQFDSFNSMGFIGMTLHMCCQNTNTSMKKQKQGRKENNKNSVNNNISSYSKIDNEILNG